MFVSAKVLPVHSKVQETHLLNVPSLSIWFVYLYIHLTILKEKQCSSCMTLLIASFLVIVQFIAQVVYHINANRFRKVYRWITKHF